MTIVRTIERYLEGSGTDADGLQSAAGASSPGYYNKDDSFSIAFWYKPTVLAGEDQITSSMVTGSTRRGWFITHVTGTTPATNNGFRFFLNGDYGSSDFLIAIGPELPFVDMWYHVVLRYNGTDADWCLDGMPRANSNVIGSKPTAVTTDTGRRLRVFTDGIPSAVHPEAGISDLTLFGGYLTDAEVIELYNGGGHLPTADFSAGLAAKLDERWLLNDALITSVLSEASTELEDVGSWSTGGMVKTDVPFHVGRVLRTSGDPTDYEEQGTDGLDVTDNGATVSIEPTTPATTTWQARQYLYAGIYTGAERSYRRLRFSVDVAPGTTNTVIGIGVWTDRLNKVVAFVGYNASSGSLTIHTGQRDDTFVTRATSAATIAASVNDEIEIVFRVDRHRLYAVGRNIDTGDEAEVSWTTTRTNLSGQWDHAPSSGQPAIIMPSGDITLIDDEYSILDLKHPKNLFIGDSVGAISVAASTYANTYLAQLRAYVDANTSWGGSVYSNGSGGDPIRWALDRDGVSQELGLIAAERYIIFGAHNDFADGDSAATIAANVASLVAALEALPDVREVIVAPITPIGDGNAEILNALYATAYADQPFTPASFDDMEDDVTAGDLESDYDSGDGTHPNDAGFDALELTFRTMATTSPALTSNTPLLQAIGES